MITQAQLDSLIRAFAQEISTGPLGLIFHQPEPWAAAYRCFDNVAQKVSENGGKGLFGWMFLCRHWAEDPNLSYVMAVNHAVWHRPDGHLVDVTPFHEDPKHHPYAPGGSVLFLVDDKAAPRVAANGTMLPRPTKFQAMSKDSKLAEYVRKMTQTEEVECQKLYAQYFV